MDKLRKVSDDGVLYPLNFPKVVCLCGSTQFWQEFQDQAEAEILQGHIVVSVGIRYRDGNQYYDEDSDKSRKVTKDSLDFLHKRKIDMADEVVFINKDGYIGDSTLSELQYAQRLGKPIRFVYPDMFPANSDLTVI